MTGLFVHRKELYRSEIRVMPDSVFLGYALPDCDTPWLQQVYLWVGIALARPNSSFIHTSLLRGYEISLGFLRYGPHFGKCLRIIEAAHPIQH